MLMTEQTEQADKGWLQAKFTQAEVGYTDYAVRQNPVKSVCQTCRWFMSKAYSPDGTTMGSDCHIVECYPLDIVGTGYCNEWTARKVMEPEPMEVVIVENDEDDTDMGIGMMSRYGVDVAPPVIDDLPQRKGLQRLFSGQIETSFKVLPSGHWIAFYTNNFEDQDDEILEGKSHKDYVARVKAGLVELPVLLRSHIEGTQHGKALLVDYVETDTVVTVFAIGTFDDTPAGRSAKRYYEKSKPGDVSLSHGFIFPKQARQHGRYKVYNTFEITTLRRGQEANIFTNISTKGKNMAYTEAQMSDLTAVFGDAAPEMLKKIEERGKADKTLNDLGVKHKGKGYTDFADVNGTDITLADKTNGQALSALVALVPTLYTDSAAQLEIVEAMDKELDAVKAATNEATKAVAAVAAFEARLKALETTLEMPATPASESAATVVHVQTEAGTLTLKQLEDALTEAKAKQEIEAKKTGSGSKETVEAILFGGRNG